MQEKLESHSSTLVTQTTANSTKQTSSAWNPFTRWHLTERLKYILNTTSARKLSFLSPTLVNITVYSQHLLAGMSAQPSWAGCTLKTAGIAHPLPRPLTPCVKHSRHPANLCGLKNEHVSSGVRKALKCWEKLDCLSGLG